MNPIFMTCYNTTPIQLSMTLEAIESARNQDIGGVFISVTDNGSTDDTWPLLRDMESEGLACSRYAHNVSPLKIANRQLHHCFRDCGYQYALGIPNDVVLPPNLYSEMVRWPRGIVTASMTSDRNFTVPDKIEAVSENTPMAVMLIRSWVYEAIMAKDGYFFDENMFMYASDCDLALRLAACGIHGVQLNLPFWHYSSASWRLASPEAGRAITDQADIDRAYFERKYGFSVDDVKYGECARDINFRG